MLLVLIAIVSELYSAPKYSSPQEFLAKYMEQEPVSFFKIFPVPDTSNPVTHIKAYVAYTEKEFLSLVVIDSFDLVSTSKSYDDNNIFRGDYVALTLSTYPTKEFAYVFIASKGEGQYDFVLGNHGFTSKDWDGIWSVESKEKEGNLMILFKVPFSSIMFHDSIFYFQLDLNLRGGVISYSTDYNEPSWALFNMHSVCLKGITPSRFQYKLNAIPYMRFQRIEENEPEFAVGGIFELRPDAQSLFSFAFNPDFSTVDLDVISLDLSVGPRIFPEKRKFFLEGANAFTISLPLYNSRNIDTLHYGFKGVWERNTYSLYGLYAKHDANRDFLGFGFSYYTSSKIASPYFRFLRDDSVSTIVLGNSSYLQPLKTQIFFEGAINATNRNVGFVLSISRSARPGLGFSARITSVDSSLISPVGIMFYNNKLGYSVNVWYEWLPFKNLRNLVYFAHYGLSKKHLPENIYNGTNVSYQIVTTTFPIWFFKLGFGRTVFGSRNSSYYEWKGFYAGFGPSFKHGSFTWGIEKDLKEDNFLLNFSGSLNVLQSSLNFELSRKSFNPFVESDTTIFQFYGEVPLFKKVFLKPFVSYERSASGGETEEYLRVNMREFLYFNRFTQLAFVQDIAYDVSGGRFERKNFLLRFQLYFQIR
uniref:Carbohydrate binding family 9 domain-containing protein n=1 Tax=candidate division WOR-3 bacterium TaxID=2052148 RepID=A0A7V3ZXA0_UNCW3